MEKKLFRISRSDSFHIYSQFRPDHANKDYRKDIREIKNGSMQFSTDKLKKFGDLALFGIYAGFTEKFVNALRDGGVKNFKAYPITINHKKKDKVPSYYLLQTKCKKIQRRTKPFFSTTCVDVNTIYFDLKEWGGEDLFTIQNTLVLLCTEKVKRIIEDSNLKCIEFTELKIVTKTECFRKLFLRVYPYLVCGLGVVALFVLFVLWIYIVLQR